MKTIGTYFYLRSPESKRDTTIMLMLSKGSERIRFSTGISTAVKDWNQKKKKSNIASINKQLRSIDDKAEAYRNECELRDLRCKYYDNSYIKLNNCSYFINKI
jgi:hypothetical protein